VVLLVVGLTGGSSILLTISIGASLLAAVALVVGARQVAANRATADVGRAGPRTSAAPRTAGQSGPGVAYGPPLAGHDVPVQHVPSTVGNGGTGWRQPPEPPFDPDAPFEPEPAPAGGTAARSSPVSPAPSPLVSPASPFAARADEVPDVPAADPPAEEPAEQAITSAEAALVARLPSPVDVVDGRPRYHLASCPHLVGRLPETLPVTEAVELGFTPCATCAPATALLADVRPI